MMIPSELTAIAAARLIQRGELRAEELVRSCLDRVEAADESVKAWAFLDPEFALDQARRADEARRAGVDLGRLMGIPVGIKDIFDTRDMPTECGTPLFAGRQPGSDAAVVSRLREAGSVIMGKTVTTELAVYAPGKTTNPHDPARTPGGSSSGSAAAVAAGMVPLAIGTQTNGSVIRPASFCGVYGFKPTRGLISRQGVLAQSPPLDTVGVFARGVEDIALLCETLMWYDARDPDMVPRPRADLLATAREEPPLAPNFAFVKSPVWSEASEEGRDALRELVDLLADACDEVELPPLFDDAVRWHRTIMCADLAKSFGRLYEDGKRQLSPVLCEMIEEGQGTLAVDYNRALDMIEVLGAGLEQVFERYDAIITPAAVGEAPLGLESTGSPVFCTLWTLVGLPALSLPLLAGGNDMPMGVQLVGPRHDDARLLRTASWLARTVAAAE